jgi:hypothetical protein
MSGILMRPKRAYFLVNEEENRVKMLVILDNTEFSISPF